jgi:hypothetical protein
VPSHAGHLCSVEPADGFFIGVRKTTVARSVYPARGFRPQRPRTRLCRDNLLRKYQLLAVIVKITTIEKAEISIVDSAFLEKTFQQFVQKLRETHRRFGHGAPSN